MIGADFIDLVIFFGKVVVVEMIKYFNTLLEALQCAFAPNAGVADEKDSFLPFHQCCKTVSKSVNIVPFCVLIAVDNQYNFKN